MTEEAITLIPPGKLQCVVTGKLRPDTPEEHVRQRIARSLLEDYGYDKADIEIEFTVNLGSSKKRVDIAIFPPRVEHKQENIKIIVECKREDVRPTDRDNGVEQLKSYLSACANARFGMWIGSELQVWERLLSDKGEIYFAEATDIPRFGYEAPQPITFTELVPAHEELIGIFKRCHNYIYGNQGLQKEPAFQELLKLIFCKVYDEDTSTGEMRFFISNEERRSEIGQRRLKQTIDQLFEDVKNRYPYIFARDEQIRLDNRVLAYVVGELQRYSLLQTLADVKGAAYEQLVGSNLRGDRGEFFTPRNVCDMAARMALATYPRDKWLKLRILDPACGTGGFLVSVMNVWREYLESVQRAKWGNNESKALEETARLLREIANQYLAGIDFNPILVRAAQMNLVMHGDGSTNVYHANSLLPPGEWTGDIAEHVKLGRFDIILTNPPFGSKIPIDDPHILAQFELSTFEMENGARRASMPPEQLFIERCLQLLKPGGRLAIVLPDSILSNPGLAFIRRWILKRARIVASVDLPQVTFEPYTGTQTSVLLLQKKTSQEMLIEQETGRPRDYEIFMTTPEAVGHDRRGEVHYLRTPEGELIEYEDTVTVTRRNASGQLITEQRQQKVREKFDQLPEVVRYFNLYAYLSSTIGQALIGKDQYGSAIKHLEPHHLASIPVLLLPEEIQAEIHAEIMRAYALRDEANALLDEADELLHEKLGLPRFDESLVPYLPPPAMPRLPVNRPEMPHPKAFSIRASELNERLDASYHIPAVRTITELLKKGRYDPVTLSELTRDIHIPPRLKRIYVSKGYGVPFLRPSHLLQIRPYDLGYISRLTRELDSLILHLGDVLITTDGTVGRIGIVTSRMAGWAGSNNIARVTYGNNNCRNGFLAAFLSTPYGFYQLTREIYGGVVDHIEAPHIASVLVPNPPKEVQVSIGERVVEAFELKDEASAVEERAIRKVEEILQKGKAA